MVLPVVEEVEEVVAAVLDRRASTLSAKDVEERVEVTQLQPVVSGSSSSIFSSDESAFTPHKYIDFLDHLNLSGVGSDEVDEDVSGGAVSSPGEKKGVAVDVTSLAPPTSVALPPVVPGGKEAAVVVGQNWEVVAAGKGRVPRRVPAVAVRHSSRLPKDGVPVQLRAELRAKKCNEPSGGLQSVGVSFGMEDASP